MLVAMTLALISIGFTIVFVSLAAGLTRLPPAHERGVALVWDARRGRIVASVEKVIS